MPARCQPASRRTRKGRIGPPTGVPRLSFARRSSPDGRRVTKAGDAIYYDVKDHRWVPHVVKFSGGRSSGMLLFTLLENGLLDADRGDVVVFNNTSAEHPKTYEFAKRCKRVVENHYDIPFYWLEFQTYEDARSGEWSRLQTYRMVKPRERSGRVPDGYHSKGEVFEEMLSWTGYVPNQFRRTCTKSLKLETTRLFLLDWFAGKGETPHLGHHGAESRMTDDTIVERHKRNRGGVPGKILLDKKEYVRGLPVHRPVQRFADYSPAFRDFTVPVGGGPGEEGPPEYVALIGLRGDEGHRVSRMRERNSGMAQVEGIEGEHVYMPLADIGVTREDVNAFWQRQKWDLEVPHDVNLSNCVYCFLKGVGNLRRLRTRTGRRLRKGLEDTPSDIAWWDRMERRYGRDLQAEGRPEKGSPNRFIGFFGSGGLTYGRLTELGRGSTDPDTDAGSLSCDCTD